MVNYGKIRSSIAPKGIEVTDTKVFIAENIQEYSEDFDGLIVQGFEYDYVGYDKDEYIKHIGEQNNSLQQQLLETQLALCEIYESIGGVLLWWIPWYLFM